MFYRAFKTTDILNIVDRLIISGVELELEKSVIFGVILKRKI